MRIKSIHLQNFKRFTDLKIEGLSESAKLVLLIGSNGSGKSYIFDALNLLSRRAVEDIAYHRKDVRAPYDIDVQYHEGDPIHRGSRGWNSRSAEGCSFFGRSSLRVVPSVERIGDAEKLVTEDRDRPLRFTHEDRRFNADLVLFTSRIDKALRQPTFEGIAVDTVAIFREHIEPFNLSLKRLFGENDQTTIQIRNYDNAESSKPIQLYFKKGNSIIPFDLLSHGEKQIVILLMGFAVRKDQTVNCIIYIDEMDLHLNTALQKSVLKEIVEHWIPESSQLWTASHALGFIQYAQESENAALVDLDSLDFDEPQSIMPAQKTRFDLVEIAVPRESLASLFANRIIVVCEGKDHAIYNLACDDASRLFIPPGGSDNAAGVLAMARSNPGYIALRDRDFLMETEIIQIKEELPNYRVLPYYSIENLLYHPENISSLEILDFDARKWKAEIFRWKNSQPLRDVKFERGKIQELRTVTTLQMSRAWNAEPAAIYEAYASDDFDTYYPVVPQKKMPLDYLSAFNLTSAKLARAPWFRGQIHKITASL